MHFITRTAPPRLPGCSLQARLQGAVTLLAVTRPIPRVNELQDILRPTTAGPEQAQALAPPGERDDHWSALFLCSAPPGRWGVCGVGVLSMERPEGLLSCPHSDGPWGTWPSHLTLHTLAKRGQTWLSGSHCPVLTVRKVSGWFRPRYIAPALLDEASWAPSPHEGPLSHGKQQC